MTKYYDGTLAFLYRQIARKIPPTPENTDLKGKSVVITGANTGVGYACAKQFISRHARVTMAVRGLEKGNAARESILREYPDGQLEVMECDLASSASVAGFMDALSRKGEKFDTVILNAAVFVMSWNTSPEGYEMSIQVNVLSNALLALAFLQRDLLRVPTSNSPSIPRIVMVGSEVHAFTPFKERNEESFLDAFNDVSKFNVGDRYYVSKLLNMLWTLALCRKIDQSKLKVVMVSPGHCTSELFRELDGRVANAINRAVVWCFARSCEDGARIYMHAAEVAPDEEVHGAFYSHGQRVPTSGFSTSAEGVRCQDQLWNEVRLVLEKAQPGITALGKFAAA